MLDDRPSNASVDRRIERLEQAVEKLDDQVNSLLTTMSRIEERQQAAFELAKVRFDTSDAFAKAQAALLSGFMLKIEALTIDANKAQSDLSASPAGRLIDDRVRELRLLTQATLARVDAVEKRNAYYAGGLAVLIFLANVFAPLIQRVVGV